MLRSLYCNAYDRHYVFGSRRSAEPPSALSSTSSAVPNRHCWELSSRLISVLQLKSNDVHTLIYGSSKVGLRASAIRGAFSFRWEELPTTHVARWLPCPLALWVTTQSKLQVHSGDLISIMVSSTWPELSYDVQRRLFISMRGIAEWFDYSLRLY